MNHPSHSAGGYQPRYTKSGTSDIVKALAICIAVAAVLVFAGLAFLSPFFGGLNMKYSTGQRTGIVYKISSDKGVYWKTCEGELSLLLTTRNGEGGLINQIFEFSCSDTNVARQLEAAAIVGKPITVHYIQYWVRGYKYGSSGYDIDRIIAGPSAEQ